MLTENAGYGLRIVCYDIANDKRRRHVVRELETYGIRVQESVFECWIDEEQIKQLKIKLGLAIRFAEDSVVLYAIGGHQDDAIVIGSQISADTTFSVL